MRASISFSETIVSFTKQFTVSKESDFLMEFDVVNHAFVDFSYEML